MSVPVCGYTIPEIRYPSIPETGLGNELISKTQPRTSTFVALVVVISFEFELQINGALLTRSVCFSPF